MPSLEFLCPGTRHPVATYLSGWGSSSFYAPGASGISARRAEWFVRWTQKIADSDVVNMASFEEGLGRIMFVAGALEHERPFLGPLYKFISMHPRDSTRRIPPHVKFILRYLADQISNQRHYQCSVKVDDYRMHALVSMPKPVHSATGIGGWFPVAERFRYTRPLVVILVFP